MGQDMNPPHEPVREAFVRVLPVEILPASSGEEGAGRYPLLVRVDGFVALGLGEVDHGAHGLGKAISGGAWWVRCVGLRNQISH